MILPYFIVGIYFKDLFIQKHFGVINEKQFKEKMNMKCLENYMNNNNKLIQNNFCSLLKKIILIKLVTDFSYKNDEIIDSLNDLTIVNIFSLLNLECLNEIFSNKEKNSINFIEFMDKISKTFYDNDILFNELKGNFESKKYFSSILSNIEKNVFKKEDNLNQELIIQFTPIKFNIIPLDNNIFDFVEKNIGKECFYCKKITKYSNICLICGEKICDNKDNRGHIRMHSEKCGGNCSIFLNMNHFRIYLVTSEEIIKCNSIYLNEEGNGPKDYEIGNEYNLNLEKLNLEMKQYVCLDFQH